MESLLVSHNGKQSGGQARRQRAYASRLGVLAGWLIAVSLLGGALAAPARAVTDEEVGKAIERLKKSLLAKQEKNGAFEPVGGAQGGQTGGPTALATLALLESGESLQRPEIAKAIKWLESIKLGGVSTRGAKGGGTGGQGVANFKEDDEPTSNGTYAISLMTHVWAALPPAYYQNKVNETGTFLLTESHNGGGGFHYVPTKSPTDYDNSTTQYGVLGVWEAAKAGGRIPPEFWEKVAQHFIGCQNDDGGWQYSGGGKGGGKGSTLAMSVAGLTSMFIVQQQLFGTASKPNPKVEEALNRGLEWLDKNYAPQGNMYAMYGVERVGLASGYKFFNNKDWYRSGAELLVRYTGGDVPNTSFALLFLARGRVPVWISKLKVPGQPWNNRPNDLYYLTHLISDEREAEQNWQILPIDSNPELWLSAPLLYLSSDKAIMFTAAQKANLKRYVDLGGTLLLSPDNASAEFRKAAAELAKELYPQFPARRITNSHPLFHALFQIEGVGEEIQVVSNGARDMIILPTRDWGMEFQTRGYEYQSGKAGPPTQIMRMAMNLWTIVTDRGTLSNRLEQGLEARKAKANPAIVHVGRAKYNGNWLVEPAAWEAFSHWSVNHANLDVQTEEIDLDKIGDSDLPLIHLQGCEPRPLTQAQMDAIRKFTAKGGILLVETVGGQGTFAREFEVQWTKEFKKAATPMYSTNDPIVTGEKLAGGFNNRRAVYRREAVLRGMSVNCRLAGFYAGDRPQVILSNEDLSLGMLGVRQAGVIGYSPLYSRQMVANLLRQAVRFKEGAPPPADDDAAPAQEPAADNP